MKIDIETIEIDIDNPKERKFADWYSENKNQTKDLLYLSYKILTSPLKEYFNKKKEEENAIENTYKFEESMEVSKYKSLYEFIKSEYDSVKNSDYTNQIKKLETEIELLKNKNHIKGSMTEEFILEIVKDSFKTYDISDMSKVPHEGDIHMKKDDVFLMIESKNKRKIENKDIQKFYADIDNLKEKSLSGAIFISTSIRNIPNKGDVKLEYYNKIPILFLAFNSSEEVQNYVSKYIQFIIELCHLNTVNKKNHKTNNVIKKIYPLLEEIKALKAIIIKIKEQQLFALNITISDLENKIKRIIDKISYLVKPELFECPYCKLKFSSNRALASHLRVHK